MPFRAGFGGVVDSPIGGVRWRFIVEPKPLGVRLVDLVRAALGMVVCTFGTDVFRLSVDVVAIGEAYLPPAFMLFPLNNRGMVSIVLDVLFEAVYADGGPRHNEFVAWAFADGINPVLLSPSFVASWDNVVLVVVVVVVLLLLSLSLSLLVVVVIVVVGCC